MVDIVSVQYSQRILTTGKYLNVVRECGRDAGQKDPPRTVYREHHREYGPPCGAM